MGYTDHSLRERICQYLQEQLKAEGGPAGLLVDRQRSLPLDKGLVPAALVYLVKETAQRIGPNSTVSRREVVFRVEIRAIDEPSDQKLDPLVNWVVQQLLSDFTVGGLADGIEEAGGQWIQEASKDQVIGAVAIDFTITYRTPVNDLVAAP